MCLRLRRSTLKGPLTSDLSGGAPVKQRRGGRTVNWLTVPEECAAAGKINMAAGNEQVMQLSNYMLPSFR